MIPDRSGIIPDYQLIFRIFAAVKKKLFIASLSLLIVLAGLTAYVGLQLYGTAFHTGQEVKIRIRKGWDLQKLADELEKKALLDRKEQFVAWAGRLGYQNVKPCTISIQPGDGLKQVIDRLKANRNQTTNVVIRGSMDARSLAEALAARIEVAEDSVTAALKNQRILAAIGFDDTTWPALFIPNTYNVYVSTELGPFLNRMKKEYDNFWNADRLALAKKQGFSPLEVSVIASIVTKESNQTAEYGTIAGVYINRLRKGMLLQADPTVVYALGKAKRLYRPDTRINSPYNTYVNKGLPPGPICIPDIPAIEAVLHYQSHDYLYFCAKTDNSGTHVFARTLEEHNRNAAAFHNWLDSRGIR